MWDVMLFSSLCAHDSLRKRRLASLIRKDSLIISRGSETFTSKERGEEKKKKIFTGGERKDDWAHVNNILSSFHIYQRRCFLETLITLISSSLLSFEEALSRSNHFPILNRLIRAEKLDKTDLSPCTVTGTLIWFHLSCLSYLSLTHRHKESCHFLTLK